jgi:putative hydrolase of the HAD superfamily
MDIIFDIGNVICEWNPQRLVSEVFSAAEEQKQAMEAIICHHDWLDLDKGTLSLHQAVARASARCSLDANKIAEIFHNTPASLEPYANMTNLIRQLGENGYRLFVLSNMQEHSWQYLSTKYDFWAYFSGVVVSCQVHLIKPDARIFQHIIRQYNLVPRHTIFLDDMHDNIVAAKQFGFNTIHVQETEQSIDELYRLL